jgi:hypothetical protein
VPVKVPKNDVDIAQDYRVVFQFQDEQARAETEALCTHPNLPCWPMLHHAALALADERFWPDHLCDAVIRRSLEHWRFWASDRHLGMGRDGIRYRLSLPPGEDHTLDRLLAYQVQPVVLPYGNRALFIASLIVDDTLVEAFFLAHNPPGERVRRDRRCCPVSGYW